MEKLELLYDLVIDQIMHEYHFYHLCSCLTSNNIVLQSVFMASSDHSPSDDLPNCLPHQNMALSLITSVGAYYTSNLFEEGSKQACGSPGDK